MAAGEHVALQPALAVVLGEHLHDPPVGLVVGVDLGVDRPLVGVVLDLEQRPQAVGGDLVGAHHAEVGLLAVELEHLAEVLADRAQRALAGAAGLLERDRVLAQLGQLQRQRACARR